MLAACARPSATIVAPPQGPWRLAAQMPTARSEMPAVEIEGVIYVPGGFGGERVLEAYDPASDTWAELARLPEGRHHLMATGFQGRLYLFGGGTGLSFNPKDSAWVYDPADDSWSDLPVMPEPRFAGAAVSLKNAVYIIGGTGGSGATLVFHVDENRWSQLPAPETTREHTAAVAFLGEIWSLAGRWQGVGELARVEILNPQSGEWRSASPLSVPRGGFAAAVVQGLIIVAGGEVIMTRQAVASVEIFDPAIGTWAAGPNLPYAVHGLGAAAWQGSFYLMGGSDRAGAIENVGRVQVLDLDEVFP